ncbi:uncharacterized protein [Parasteatoda tepidariorum]|uniref:uncharacterized protein n=1 Tax=Parasteatoda tepidariorum TaxID=114398 RepID=UPI00077FB6D8|nr:uncharacterized protein LOC107446174 [Parasteatoda tepidariorum]
MEKHLEFRHAGTQTLMSILRESYWIIKTRKTVRQVIRRCVICRIYGAQPIETINVLLPEDRVTETMVFEVVGTDLCGPFFLKEGHKSWVVIFICAVYRAVHLELVLSSSTECFLLTFRRFIARRGRPFIVYSDNGTNLVGAANELKSVNWEEVGNFATAKKIRWKFNLPSAPW